MQFETIGQIYDLNDVRRGKLLAVVEPLAADVANALPEGEKWTISQVVEHIAIVSGGVQRICAKLLSKAEAAGKPADGSIDLTILLAGSAKAAELKFEAPEMVQPTGNRSIAESVQALGDVTVGLRTLQPAFEMHDGNAFRFPHPYFGDLSAIEWLLLCGEHEGRHTRQIKNILTKLS